MSPKSPPEAEPVTAGNASPYHPQQFSPTFPGAGLLPAALDPDLADLRLVVLDSQGPSHSTFPEAP